jgi:phytoene/squalene synthetase
VDQYTDASYKVSKLITNAYSTSFGLSIRLFEASLRPHIYAIYGLVRIADEIVDTYSGSDQRELLDSLESETKRALKSGYSTNPVVHAFTQTARSYSITSALLTPFFKSMRMDLTPQKFDQKKYEQYIFGSAEVVGLMCLKVFTNDQKQYDRLEKSAGKLGSAYQKVNFLRDIAADADGLGRWYFPIASKETFDEKAKTAIIKDIEKDFAAAKKAITKLPLSSRKAVSLSYDYYLGLLAKIKRTSAADLMKKRIRINDPQKLALLVRTSLTGTRRA